MITYIYKWGKLGKGMKNSNKIFNKIKSIIYNQGEGKYNKERAFDKIKEVMDTHSLIDKNIEE